MTNKENSVETIIHLLAKHRFDELFVDRDRLKFNSFLREFILPNSEFAVSLPIREGLMYFIYPVERLDVLEKIIKITWAGARRMKAIVPRENTGVSPKEIKDIPIFHLSETDLWQKQQSADEL